MFKDLVIEDLNRIKSRIDEIDHVRFVDSKLNLEFSEIHGNAIYAVSDKIGFIDHRTRFLNPRFTYYALLDGNFDLEAAIWNILSMSSFDFTEIDTDGEMIHKKLFGESLMSDKMLLTFSFNVAQPFVKLSKECLLPMCEPCNELE